eukprot:scaffold13009_cov62-Phaeocystis_antarctica.AAC.2
MPAACAAATEAAAAAAGSALGMLSACAGVVRGDGAWSSSRARAFMRSASACSMLASTTAASSTAASPQNSHTKMASPPPTVSSDVPSAEKATRVTWSEWPTKACTSAEALRPRAVLGLASCLPSHTLTMRSLPPLTTYLPLCETCSASATVRCAPACSESLSGASASWPTGGSASDTRAQLEVEP